MLKINVRKAQNNDVSFITELEKKYIELPWSEQQIKDCIINPLYTFLVVEADNCKIGYASVRINGAEAEINNVVVDENFRSHGYATTLINNLLSIAKDNNVITVYIEVAESNLPAYNLYKKLEFNFLYKRKNYYPSGDALVMQKMI